MTNGNSRVPKTSRERSQTPLYVAIVGLFASLYSFAMAEEALRTVVMFGGVVVTVVAILYWLINPKHGFN